jgi:hypothetical protein
MPLFASEADLGAAAVNGSIVPLSGRSPSQLALFMYAIAAKVGNEPNFPVLLQCTKVRFNGSKLCVMSEEN